MSTWSLPTPIHSSRLGLGEMCTQSALRQDAFLLPHSRAWAGEAGVVNQGPGGCYWLAPQKEKGLLKLFYPHP